MGIVHPSMLSTLHPSRCSALSRIGVRPYSSYERLTQNVRPSFAPKQFPDVKGIRQRPEVYSQNTELRNYEKHKDHPQQIERLSERIRDINSELRQPRTDLKALEKRFGQARATKQGAEAEKLYADIQNLRSKVDQGVEELDALSQDVESLALSLPNLTSEQTPKNGEPKVLEYINYDPAYPPSSSPEQDHAAIGQTLGILDFAAASTTTGWGFYYLLNEAVLLENAMTQYATSIALKHGWGLVTPPSLVYSHIADSCGFQPRDANDEQQIWQVAQSDKDTGKPRRSLAATAEIPIAALYANQSLSKQQLPLKLIGTSRCYRAEAGARGVDTKGLYRVHEFSKTEMFAWTDSTSEHSWSDTDAQEATLLFEEMVSIQKEILRGLELPCRVLEMPSSDLGASAFRKVDIEAFFPSRVKRNDGWGELSSASICTDYQARRLNTRILDRDGGRTRFPHTVNGTAMAVPRVMACILENNWHAREQYVAIPNALRPYMGNTRKISLAEVTDSASDI